MSAPAALEEFDHEFSPSVNVSHRRREQYAVQDHVSATSIRGTVHSPCSFRFGRSYGATITLLPNKIQRLDVSGGRITCDWLHSQLPRILKGGGRSCARVVSAMK